MKRMKHKVMTKHHIIPKSRDKRRMWDDRNICAVEKSKHQQYHNLFYNKLPEEIVEYLNCVFWNGNYDIEIQERYQK